MGEERIKSALEKALERAGRVGELSAEERERLEYVPIGHAMAARFLRERDYDLQAELERYKGRPKYWLRQGIEEILLRNIVLPVDGTAVEGNKRAMEGLVIVKKDKKEMYRLLSELEYLFNYYQRAVEHAYLTAKEHFAARADAAKKAMEAQLGVPVRIDPEKQPGFRETWLRMLHQFSGQYEAMLQEWKEKVRLVS